MTSEEVEKVIEDVCDNFCRFPQMYLQRYNDTDDAAYYMVEEVCKDCPLDKLRKADRTE